MIIGECESCGDRTVLVDTRPDDADDAFRVCAQCARLVRRHTQMKLPFGEQE